MVSKCANPGCATDFKYFREGRIYEFVVAKEGACTTMEPPSKNARRELFWLCQECAQQYTLECSKGEIHIVGREHKAA
jgi:hypothetical protein